MANENDSVLSNSYDSSEINYNNNETETTRGSSSSPSSQNKNKKCEIASKVPDKSTPGSDVNNCSEDYKNIKSTIPSEGVGHPVEQSTRREENPLSFTHFLNRYANSASLSSSSNNCNVIVTASNSSSTMTFIPNTVTTGFSNESNFNLSNNNSNHDETNTANRTSTMSINLSAKEVAGSEKNFNQANFHTVNATLPSQSTTSSSYKVSTGARPKVPQSSSNNIHHQSQHPYQQQQQQPQQQPSTSISTTSMSSLSGETCKMKRSPRFSSFDSQASLAEYAGSGLNGSGNFRDIIQLDVIDRETNNSMKNFFVSSGNEGDNDFHDKQHYVQRSLSNYDMDLPPQNSNTASRLRVVLRKSNRSSTGGMPQSSNCKNYSGSDSGGGLIGPRPNPEFPNVLPDFVQDHWMDPWYYNDMNLSSPPNSPISSPVDFVEDISGGGGMIGGGNANTAEKCQTLPDFLSDGPIHSSSARLADVAAGLPPDLDSPEDNSPSLQLARLRLENERLRRELDESRLSLAEQTRKAGELERRLEHAKITDFYKSQQNAVKIDEENLDQSKKRAAAAQSQVSKLKQQIKQLKADIDVLRRENESLREDGAVGGDRISRRPSRIQQLSRDLMRAASNAENNLRQLLTGVENLRLMATTIENMDRISIDSTNQANPINDDDFLSDSDVDFDDFSGPAL